MNLKWKLHVFNFNPTTDQLAETGAVLYPVMGVLAGTWVKFAAIRIGVAFTAGTPTITVGETTVDRFIRTADITMGSAALYVGYGSGLSATNGFLFTAVDTIDLRYTGDALTTAGSAIVYVIYAETE